MKLCLICHLEFVNEQSICPKDKVELVPIGDDPLVGSIIQDRYKIESVLGKGSMGVVYKASQELLGREVAIKVLHAHLVSNKEFLQRFQQQAKAASRLNNPHIVTMYDYGIIPGRQQPYMVMDLLIGKTLVQLLKERKHLNTEEVMVIFRQVCIALTDAHEHGVIHRDIKPENIVLEEDGQNSYWVKVVDFGIAKIIDQTDDNLMKITKTGTVCGSPAYMSPEQFKGTEIDARSDIYSLGVVLFEMLTGQLPFMATDLVTLMSKHATELPPKLSQVMPQVEFSPQIENVVAKSLSKDPSLRQQSMSELWRELELALSTRLDALDEADQFLANSSADGELVLKDAIDEVMMAHMSRVGRRLHIAEYQDNSSRGEKNLSLMGLLSRVIHAIPGWSKLVGSLQNTIPYVVALTLLLVVIFLLEKDFQLWSKIENKINKIPSYVHGLLLEHVQGPPSVSSLAPDDPPGRLLGH